MKAVVIVPKTGDPVCQLRLARSLTRSATCGFPASSTSSGSGFWRRVAGWSAGPLGRGGFTQQLPPMAHGRCGSRHAPERRGARGRSSQRPRPGPRSCRLPGGRSHLSLRARANRYEVRDLVNGNVREFAPLDHGGRPRAARSSPTAGEPDQAHLRRWTARRHRRTRPGARSISLTTVTGASRGSTCACGARAVGGSEYSEYDANGGLAAVVSPLGEKGPLPLRHQASPHREGAPLRPLLPLYLRGGTGDRCIQSRAQGNLQNVELFPRTREAHGLGVREP